jgi:GDP-L-fucose synthase
VVGYEGKTFDPSKPDGTPRKLLDVSRMRALGWGVRVVMRNGLQSAYDDFLRQRRFPQ